MTVDWIMVAVGVLLTAGTAIFVAGEFSLVTLDPAVVGDDEEGDRPGPAADSAAPARPGRRDRAVRAALKSLSTELSSAQVGITVTTILLGYTAQPALVSLLGGWFGSFPMSGAVGLALATVLALVLVNGFSMLFGELIPKNFALSLPLRTARLVIPLQRVFTLLFKPVILLLNGSANALLRRVGVEPREELSGARSATELASLVRRSAAEGTLEKSVAQLLTNSIELHELSANDVMTDRMRMVVVERDATAADVVRLAMDTGHSRFPVIGQDRDDVVGLVNLRRAVGVPHERRAEVPATALMVDAPRVPETVGLGPLLVELRDLGLQMAVVVDEYGGTSGVVTLEDVVEELVGEVADEHDRRRAGVVRAPGGEWVVPAVLRPDELEENTGVVVPEGAAYETLGGLVMAELGRVPRAGDEVTVAGATLRVEAMDGRRVERVRVRPVRDGAESGASPTPAVGHSRPKKEARG
ncbi:hemolysin family protein [Myceligenerans pegani]|uniref:HlyC/CorC family transporter n=1 Tax=Myceligenerans pegani TaxID=2776917 RepID=A0ABR9MZ11_9MICO|nr:hemolysin family protein [Myceligenerans sp. TRM 65318]MBE1876174.1 HlyC/CorC family transporter [Myceligenerans sp. TRM 65318]MBE3018445.1 HlyC/CorC family transporter [Myceligenerans sp. TRM 65318]